MLCQNLLQLLLLMGLYSLLRPSELTAAHVKKIA